VCMCVKGRIIQLVCVLVLQNVGIDKGDIPDLAKVSLDMEQNIIVLAVDSCSFFF
jgi:hypothetical protein